MTTDKKLKQKIKDELYRFLFYAIFLTLFFCSLTAYKRLLLGEYSISYLHYGSGLIQALILSKILIIGEHFHFGEKYEDRSLIIPTLHKTVIFSFLVLVFSVIEHFGIGFFEGHDFVKDYQELASTGIDAILAKVLVIFFVFILFFAFSETGRVLGEGELFKLFLHRKSKKD